MAQVKTKARRRKQNPTVRPAKDWEEVRRWIDSLQQEWAERNGKSSAGRYTK